MQIPQAVKEMTDACFSLPVASWFLMGLAAHPHCVSVAHVHPSWLGGTGAASVRL